ncbi:MULTISPECIES: glycosyltransferase family 4 protein [Nostocales]|uniref:Glycosyltransferase family 4 protein n=3 Tax=Nostocales TaxID=1161 RepID=A0A8S9SZ90_9CYAN|nr:glycosyltransferase family 4 protein [Tolypothrix bouteillei]KAF3884589.1 glycosyltransferase family 4 protein [Tolypothrix bouteillei VB521301]
MSYSKILVAQLGARKHYQEPLLFHRWGILDRLYTDFYSGHNKLTGKLRNSRIYNHLPNALKKGLDRYEPELQNAKIIHFPKLGYQYLQALKKAPPEQAPQIYIWAGQKFCQQIIQHGLGDANTIYGFNSACLELFEYAKKRGIRCVLDQTLAEWSLVHKLLLEEEQRWPGWSLSPFKVGEADLELLEREQREQDLADRIICGSSFVKNSLIARGVDGEKISVLPLGRLKERSLIQNSYLKSVQQNDDETLKILFVGSVNLRKGIPYLLKALKQIKGKISFTCKVVGSLEINYQRVTEYSDVCTFLGRVPRAEMKDLYNWADVFVLPSICEGSAMVTYEALLAGIPTITTDNSGSIVRDGIDGAIVPIREIDAIANQLLHMHTTKKAFSTTNNTQEYLDNLMQESENKLRQIVTFQQKKIQMSLTK